jgi:hypothetical protein
MFDFDDYPTLIRQNRNPRPLASRNFVRPAKNLHQPRSNTVTENLTVTHSNPKAIDFIEQKTSVKTTWKKSEDEFKTSIIKISSSYDFTTKALTFKIVPTCLGEIQISFIEILCNKSTVDYENSSIGYTVLLSSRHVFDTNFFLTLKYSLIDRRGIANFDSKYGFKVS